MASQMLNDATIASGSVSLHRESASAPTMALRGTIFKSLLFLLWRSPSTRVWLEPLPRLVLPCGHGDHGQGASGDGVVYGVRLLATLVWLYAELLRLVTLLRNR
jgi:hypothetical protein